MGIQIVEMYEVVCDEPGCEVKTGTDGEYSAWADKGYAVDEWIDGDRQWDSSTERAWCQEHKKPYCIECDTFKPVDDDSCCDDCRAAERGFSGPS